MRYVLATTERVFRWYVFDPKTVSSTAHSLSEVLDLNIVLVADKITANFWALRETIGCIKNELKI